jgi:hypothetical protein
MLKATVFWEKYSSGRKILHELPLTRSAPPVYLTRSHLSVFRNWFRGRPFSMSSRRKYASATPVSLRRRVLLKTTAKALVGWIALAVVLSARIAVAAPLDYTQSVWLGVSAMGQLAPATGNASEDKGQQTADMLRRARQAMAENDLVAADSLVSQAEALGVQYNALYMGDTPKKARRDLDRKRNAPGVAAAKPSQMLAPLGLNKNKQAPTSDPFAGRGVNPAAGAPDAGQVTPLPKVDGASPIRALAAQANPPLQTPADQANRPAGPGVNDARPPVALNPNMVASAGNAAPVANNSPLRTARLALAVGDVRRAAEQLQQAKGMQVNYQPLDDTPDKVEMAIRKYQEMSALDKSTEAYRRAYARNLLEQADALLRWGDQDEAERLASRAAGMQIVYGPFEQKPQDLLQRLPARVGKGQVARLRRPPRRLDLPALRQRPGRPLPRDRRLRSWSARHARRWPPINWIERKRSPVRPNNYGCPTRPLHRAKIVRAWCCSICVNCDSAAPDRASYPPADST